MGDVARLRFQAAYPRLIALEAEHWSGLGPDEVQRRATLFPEPQHPDDQVCEPVLVSAGSVAAFRAAHKTHRPFEEGPPSSKQRLKLS